MHQYTIHINDIKSVIILHGVLIKVPILSPEGGWKNCGVDGGLSKFEKQVPVSFVEVRMDRDDSKAWLHPYPLIPIGR